MKVSRGRERERAGEERGRAREKSRGRQNSDSCDKVDTSQVATHGRILFRSSFPSSRLNLDGGSALSLSLSSTLRYRSLPFFLVHRKFYDINNDVTQCLATKTEASKQAV